MSSVNFLVKSHEQKVGEESHCQAAALESLALKNTEILTLKKSLSKQTEKALHYESISVAIKDDKEQAEAGLAAVNAHQRALSTENEVLKKGLKSF